MISRSTINTVIDTARIEEVVGDYVHLKKRGANYLGHCPFHNEKTPSFNVNPARNIFKCFGCGKGGNAVNFIMEHEHFSYPEAIKFLANKYNIAIEETQPSPEALQQQDDRESMMILNSFAQKTFSDQLLSHEEGLSVALPYFNERGFSRKTIANFQLGYALNEWDAFTQLALKAGYQLKFLQETGLSTKGEEGKKVVDRFKGRVIFPIHNLSGRVIGFGGRILKKDDKSAKYLNSPESEVYHKSQSLYGIYFAKKSIVLHDVCFLVEGYTDVISMHQCGIENVVASSGTALTKEQIRLIARYTNNITLLYDGDAAGIKASLRGIDLILEEGLIVKLVLFPDGDDPDSYSRKNDAETVRSFINKNATDFIEFKAKLLVGEAQQDPVARTNALRQIVESIAKVPDPILRSNYIKHCAYLLDMQEQILINETNKIRKSALKKELTDDAETPTVLMPSLAPPKQSVAEISLAHFEKEIIRLLINYANHQITIHDEGGNAFDLLIGNYIADDLIADELNITDKLYNKIYQYFLLHQQQQTTPDITNLIHHIDPEVSSITVELLSEKYILSVNWESMHQIIVPTEKDKLREAIDAALLHFKRKLLMEQIKSLQTKLASIPSPEETDQILVEIKKLTEVRNKISLMLGIVVH